MRPEQFSFPEFADPAAERLHLKQRLAATFRLFGRFGFNEGVAGHVTARDPERTDCFWVNPFGLSFDLVCASDLILVDHEGTIIEGDWPVNQAGPSPFTPRSTKHALTSSLRRTPIRSAGVRGRRSDGDARPDHAGLVRVLPGPCPLR